MVSYQGTEPAGEFKYGLMYSVYLVACSVAMIQASDVFHIVHDATDL